VHHTTGSDTAGAVANTTRVWNEDMYRDANTLTVGDDDTLWKSVYNDTACSRQSKLYALYSAQAYTSTTLSPSLSTLPLPVCV
jgi:hypothetical protein